MITVKHSGNIGDIIYSLPTVKYLSETQNSPINFILNVNDEFMNIHLTNALIPLLKHQSYIHNVELYDNQIIDYDLDKFREIHNGGDNLGKSHSDLFNFDTSILNTQSLFVGDDITYNFKNYDIIINRTNRYQNNTFPWNYILDTEYKNSTKCFVGLRHEYENFIQTFNLNNIEYVETTDLLQVAYLIKNSKIFIGNCSSPYAIAETMKHQSIQESCTWCLSCLYPRNNAYYFTTHMFQI
jgi:hypothetical protein